MAEEVTLLIDGDVLAYRAASAVQKVEEDAFGYVSPFANIVEGKGELERHLLRVMDGLGATHIRVILSDPESNWRHELMPTYKGNRADVQRPLLLGRLKDFLRDRFGATHWPGMEADDVLGILATEPQAYPGTRIVVGKDKDFKSIPGLHHKLGDNDANGEPIVREIGEWEADRWHLVQTLSGDRIDGYYGCPGIGPERAERIVAEPKLLSPQKGTITRGPRKGQETTKWVSEPTNDFWACIVTHYAKEGKGEADALLTARMAHILRHEDYDRATDTIKLWTPERLRKWQN